MDVYPFVAYKAPHIYVLLETVQFSRFVMSDSLQPHEPQHARPPVHHQLPESTQTHVHGVSDAIQPSCPLSSPSPPAPNLSQHQETVSLQIMKESEIKRPWQDVRADLLPLPPPRRRQLHPFPRFPPTLSTPHGHSGSRTLTADETGRVQAPF